MSYIKTMDNNLDIVNTFKKTIQSIQDQLNSYLSRDHNEQSIKQGIILPILRDLSWPTDNPNVVSPEYAIEGGRVDYALCHHDRPIILIEAKRFHRIDGAAAWQLFRYTFHLGTPLVILTDGLQWQFFMPAGEGSWEERVLCTINLLQDDIDEIVRCFFRYLQYEAVTSRKAIECAHLDYRQIRQDKDTYLTEGGNISPLHKITIVEKPRTGKSSSSAGYHFVFKGKEYSARNAQTAAVQLFNILAEEDPSILDRIADSPNHGENRKYLARSREVLYPENPQRTIENSFEFRTGWWIPGNIGRRSLTRIMEMICSVTGLGFGKDLKMK